MPTTRKITRRVRERVYAHVTPEKECAHKQTQTKVQKPQKKGKCSVCKKIMLAQNVARHETKCHILKEKGEKSRVNKRLVKLEKLLKRQTKRIDALIANRKK